MRQIAIAPRPAAVMLFPVEIDTQRKRTTRDLAEWNRRVRQFNKGKLR